MALDTSEIESEFQRIRLAVNRIGITFRAPIEWCIKYDNYCSSRGKGIASDEDISYFNNILKASVNKSDLYLIEYAMNPAEDCSAAIWFPNQRLAVKFGTEEEVEEFSHTYLSPRPVAIVRVEVEDILRQL